MNLKQIQEDIAQNLRPLYANGATPIFNETRHGFELTLPLADEVTSEVTGEAGAKSGLSRDQVGILRKCLTGSAIGDLMAVSGRTNRTKFRDQVLNPLLEVELVEMTIPDKPRSRLQKYRLTEKGRQLLGGGE